MRGTWAFLPPEGQHLCSCLDNGSYSNHPHQEIQQKVQHVREEARCFRWGWKATPLKKKKRRDGLHADTEHGVRDGAAVTHSHWPCGQSPCEMHTPPRPQSVPTWRTLQACQASICASALFFITFRSLGVETFKGSVPLSDAGLL